MGLDKRIYVADDGSHYTVRLDKAANKVGFTGAGAASATAKPLGTLKFSKNKGAVGLHARYVTLRRTASGENSRMIVLSAAHFATLQQGKTGTIAGKNFEIIAKYSEVIR
jgi:hypothetical protein